MAADTREALINAATTLLDDGGPGNVTLREVGRLAGVSHNAPYKHFANKDALLAAIAARELARQQATIGIAISQDAAGAAIPGRALELTLRHYVRWALDHPARFKLVFGAWTTPAPELEEAAGAAHDALIGVVAAAQSEGGLPAGDPVRLAALLRATAHGAADLASSGHLAAGGKGNADPIDLVDDLLIYLARASHAQHLTATAPHHP